MIADDENRGSTSTYSMNGLPQNELAFTADEVDNEEDGDIILRDRTSDEPPTFSASLTAQQNTALQEFLCQFGDVFRESPGKMGVVEHGIETDSASLICLALYCLPHA